MHVIQSKSNLFLSLKYLLLKSGYVNFMQFFTAFVHNLLSIYKTLDIFQEQFLVLCFLMLLQFFLQHSSLLVYVGLRNEFYLFENS